MPRSALRRRSLSSAGSSAAPQVVAEQRNGECESTALGPVQKALGFETGHQRLHSPVGQVQNLSQGVEGSALATGSNRQGFELVGTPDSVAGRMQEIMQEVGGDGFLIFNTYFDRRYVMEVCEGLVPELQRRGVVRKQYAHKHLMDNLMEF